MNATSLAILALAMPALLLESGCSQVDEWRYPDAAACRSFVLGSLRSPSTYKEFSLTRRDEANGLIKSVFIEYDAANAYGTPVRNAQKCEFAYDRSKSAFVTEPKLAATLASADRALGTNQTSSCCLSKTDSGNVNLMPVSPLPTMSAEIPGTTNSEGAH